MIEQRKISIVLFLCLAVVLVTSPVFGGRYEPTWGGLFSMPAGYQGIEHDFLDPIMAGQAPIPIDWSPAYSGWGANYLLDDDLGSQYVTNGYINPFFWDFDFSYYTHVPKDIAGFAHLQRNDGSDVASATLTFSNDPNFTTVIETIVISSFNTVDTPTVVTFPTVSARYCRFEGVPQGQAWVGGREVVFMEEIPEPATLGLLVCGAFGLIAKRRRS